jgi:hypothetical protein
MSNITSVKKINEEHYLGKKINEEHHLCKKSMRSITSVKNHEEHNLGKKNQ